MEERNKYKDGKHQSQAWIWQFVLVTNTSPVIVLVELKTKDYFRVERNEPVFKTPTAISYEYSSQNPYCMDYKCFIFISNGGDTLFWTTKVLGPLLVCMQNTCI